MINYWIAVASREHVQLGVKGGFMQVCHGKCGPLQRIKPGDWVIYYSPVEIFGEKTPCRKFTALGQVGDGDPYQFKMSDDFIPWRRDVVFKEIKECLIEPLINELTFIKNKQHWGFPFRRGCFNISFLDFSSIAKQIDCGQN